jgi:hypothetical protein
MARNLISKLQENGSSILITGHTGFKGTWMTLLLEKLGIEVFGYSLEPTDSSLYNRLSRADKIVEILTYTASIFNSTTNPQGVSIEGTIAKVHASHTSVTLAPIQYQPVQVGTPLTGTETLAYEKDTVNKGASTENKSVVSDIVAIQSIPSPAATVNVLRFYKRFEVIEQPDNTLAWEFVTDFDPMGTWDNLTAYSVNDLVLYDNQEWICIIGVNAGGLNPAADVVNWKLFANI